MMASNFKQYAAQSIFENFTYDMLSLINKFEKIIYNQKKWFKIQWINSLV